MLNFHSREQKYFSVSLYTRTFSICCIFPFNSDQRSTSLRNDHTAHTEHAGVSIFGQSEIPRHEGNNIAITLCRTRASRWNSEQLLVWRMASWLVVVGAVEAIKTLHCVEGRSTACVLSPSAKTEVSALTETTQGQGNQGGF